MHLLLWISSISILIAVWHSWYYSPISWLKSKTLILLIWWGRRHYLICILAAQGILAIRMIHNSFIHASLLHITLDVIEGNLWFDYEWFRTQVDYRNFSSWKDEFVNEFINWMASIDFKVKVKPNLLWYQLNNFARFHSHRILI